MNGMFELYNAGDEEVIERLNKRHGKEKLKQMVGDYMSKKWIKGNTVACPSCYAQIEVRNKFLQKKKTIN